MGEVEVSFIIPAYNEEESLLSTLVLLDDIVKPKNLKYEIVVVDDGSNDATLSKAREYARTNGHVKVVTYDRNMGKGYAVRAGFTQTDGDIVLFADSDMDIDFRVIASYIAALQHCDIVIASKWHPESCLDVPLARKILSRSLNVLVRLLTGTKFKDTQSGLKAMRRSAFVDIFPRLSVKRYAFDVELLAVANFRGLKIVEMPVKIKIRGLFRLHDVFRMFVDVLGITYRLRVLHWYQRNNASKNEFF